jgi:hypothetical protein
MSTLAHRAVQAVWKHLSRLSSYVWPSQQSLVSHFISKFTRWFQSTLFERCSFRWTTYKPLVGSNKEIRLLHLFPGNDEAELRCALSVASHDDDPKYEAVSYVWGPLEDLGHISIALFEEHVSITKSLQSVLRSLRLPDRPRILWVDALVINREDLDERAAQVTLMGQIYRQAERVLVYLGDHFEGCELAMEAIRQLASDESPHSSSSMEPGLNVDGIGLDSREAPRLRVYVARSSMAESSVDCTRMCVCKRCSCLLWAPFHPRSTHPRHVQVNDDQAPPLLSQH